MEKRTLIEIPEELWFSSLKVEPFFEAFQDYEPLNDPRAYTYTVNPWWYGFNTHITITLPIAHLKRVTIPSRKFSQLKIKLIKTRIQTTVPLRI